MLRKWIPVLLALLLFSSAAAEGELRGYDAEAGYIYVTLGEYPQVIDGGIPDDGTQAWRWRKSFQKNKVPGEMREEGIDRDAVEPSPILWRVLRFEEGQAFLLSEYILFPSPAHSSTKEYEAIGNDFSQTDLSRILNGEFMEKAFTEAEQNAIIPYETLGKVFILSTADLKDPDIGFGKNKKTRKAWATEYAIRACGAFVYQTTNGNHSPYWTRDKYPNKVKKGSPDYNPHATQCTKADGSVGYYSCTNPEEGARPALYLDIAKLKITEGDGTKENPFRLSAEE